MKILVHKQANASKRLLCMILGRCIGTGVKLYPIPLSTSIMHSNEGVEPKFKMVNGTVVIPSQDGWLALYCHEYASWYR